MLNTSRAILCCALGLCAAGYAQESPEAAPPVEEARQGMTVQGILLVPSEEILKTLDPSHVRGVVNSQVPLPGDNQKILDEIEKKYLGQPLTQEELIKIKRAIIRYYRREGHPAVAVRISQQDIDKGVAIFIISEAKVENVEFQGKRWVSKEQLEKYFDIQKGEYIAQDVLLNNVDWLNTNPFRRTFVAFPPSSEEGVSDLKFINEDRFPARFFVGGDNSGTRFTGRTRLYGGVTWGHFMGLDDLVHYQYTINPNLNKFQSHYGSYVSFLSWKHIASIYGLYETTHSDRKLVQLSFRYTIPLEPLNSQFKHEATVGADYKNTNTNLFFVDTHPIFSRTVNITQLTLNYSFDQVSEMNDLDLALEVFFSPGQLLANQTDGAYHSLRKHAKSWYGYGRLTVGDVVQLPRCFSLSGLLRLQASLDPLLPTEQFGLGGYNTVRGYFERAFNADEALCANIELRFPSLRLTRRWEDELIFLGFIDYGIGYNLRPSAGYPSSGHLLGIGPGLRYQIDTHFSVRADYGFRLQKVHGESGHGGMGHIGVVGLF